jgi:ferredoxin
MKSKDSGQWLEDYQWWVLYRLRKPLKIDNLCAWQRHDFNYADGSLLQSRPEKREKMRVRIDATKCSGYGVCAEICPSVFKTDEFGYAQILGDGTVPAGKEESAAEAVEKCPEHALATVIEA